MNATKILSLYNQAELKKIKLAEAVVQKVFLTKIAYIKTIRNEWVNWNGDTSTVGRSHVQYFFTDLQSAKDSAEKSRERGTRLAINEAPALCAAGFQHCLIFSVASNASPSYEDLEKYLAAKDVSLQTLIDGYKAHSFPQFRMGGLFCGNESLLQKITTEETFYTLTGASAGAKNGLAWSYKKLNIDATILEKNSLAFSRQNSPGKSAGENTRAG